MSWILAFRRYPVVTGAATTKHLRMINVEGRRPDIWVVTVFAYVGRLHV